MDTKKLFLQCLSVSTDIVSRAKVVQYSDPTPDTQWDVYALVSHMLYELSWVPDILGGKTLASVGTKYDGDLVKDDLKKNWIKAANLALDAVEKVDLSQKVHLSYGEFSADHYLREQSNDLIVHAWDLGNGIGIDVTFDKSVADELYNMALPRKNELSSSGLFAPPIDVPESADTQVKLLALLGRRAT